MKFLITFFLWLLFFSVSGFAQQIALKTNALYLATGTPNLSLEFATGKKHSIAFEGGIQSWQYSKTKKLKHWLIQPEFRYWPCEAFNGHFWGINLLGGQFNAGGVKLPCGIFPSLYKNRYQGWAAGGGISYDYQWMLNRRWSLECSLGVGYLYLDYKKYRCAACGKMKEDTHRNYLGPTKVAISLVYVLK